MRKARTKAAPLSSNLERRSWEQDPESPQIRAVQPQVIDLETAAASHEVEEIDRFYKLNLTKINDTQAPVPILRKCSRCKTTLVVQPGTRQGDPLRCFKCGKLHKAAFRVVLEPVPDDIADTKADPGAAA